MRKYLTLGALIAIILPLAACDPSQQPQTPGELGAMIQSGLQESQAENARRIGDQPSVAQGQVGQPPFGQPQMMAQPQFSQQPPFGQPQFGQPQFGQPQFGQPGMPLAPGSTVVQTTFPANPVYQGTAGVPPQGFPGQQAMVQPGAPIAPIMQQNPNAIQRAPSVAPGAPSIYGSIQPQFRLNDTQITQLFQGNTVYSTSVSDAQQRQVGFFGRDLSLKVSARGEKVSGSWFAYQNQLCYDLGGPAICSSVYMMPPPQPGQTPTYFFVREQGPDTGKPSVIVTGIQPGNTDRL